MELVRYADRPDLHEVRFRTLSARTFPEFMHHGQTGMRYWGRLVSEHPDFQLALVDDGELVAELRSRRSRSRCCPSAVASDYPSG